MKPSNRIRPFGFLKARAAEIVRTPGVQGEPLLIIRKGEAKAVLQVIESCEETQETMALLRMLALGSRQIELGPVQPAAARLLRPRDQR